MAIDYIIGGLQLISAAVNVLALGAFWVTPGLRTTANRFVINLLVVNIIGCLAITPALWLHGGLKSTVHSESRPIVDVSVDTELTLMTASTMPSLLSDEMAGNELTVIKSVETKIECVNQGDSKHCKTMLIEENSDGLVTEIVDDETEQVEMVDEVQDESLEQQTDRIQQSNSSEQLNNNSIEHPSGTTLPTKNIQYSDCTRFWGFDLAAALGGLSVVLVVGDTWCAVTDPLRYHSRISGLKSWVLIASTWFISILFCIASALRRDCLLITTEITSTLQGKYWSSSIGAQDQHPQANITLQITGDSLRFDDIYNLIFSCTFFVVIILMPICLVCAMYWKIFSEARQNGLRMRQNGSSPLLQSALNLATASAQVPTAQLDSCFAVIGEEESDNQVSNDSCSSNINTLQPLRRNSVATTQHHVSIKDSTVNLNYNKSILIKLHSSPTKAAGMYQHSRRYLEIPKLMDSPQQKFQMEMKQSFVSIDEKSLNSLASDSIKQVTVSPQQTKRTIGSRQLLLLKSNGPKSNENASELRQVHSTPDLQKSISAELLACQQAVNANKKIHSTGSIHTSQALPNHPPSICTPPKALSYMTSIRHRLSNASSIFKYREESRAARISILVVIMFLLSYLPYGLLVLLQGRVTFINNPSFLGVLFLLIANTSSPFIFAYRNRRVRRGVCRLFGVDTKTNERLQKQRILMRNSTHTSSCRDRKQKAKIVRIDRNSKKSASFSITSTPCKYSAVSLLATDEYRRNSTPAETVFTRVDGVGKTVLVTIPDDCCILPTVDDSEADDDESDSIKRKNKQQSLATTPLSQTDDSGNQDQSISNKEKTKNIKDIIKNQHETNHIINNSSNNSNHKINCNGATGANVIKQKIYFLKRVCKTSRKLSNCASANQIHFDCAQQPVNI